MSSKRSGHFDAERREYVITDPRAPMPWMNYLFNDEYYALISATAGGYSFHQSARDKRILRYRLNNLPADRPGRYLYLRRRDSGAFWSATWAPVQADPQPDFVCRHGLGYTVIRHRCSGVVEMTVDGRAVEGNVVPPPDPGRTRKVFVRLGPGGSR